MKIFHTSDWHIGKLLHKENLISEQREVLIKFLDDIDRKKPDIVIVAGDIYDTSIPRIEAIELLDDIMNEIISRDIALIIISGNHDSAERLSFGNKMFRKNGLYIITDYEDIESPLVFEDEFGKVNFYPFPFITVARGKQVFSSENEKEPIESYDKLAEVSIKKALKNFNSKERNIAIYHGFLMKLNDKDIPITSESERPLSIGGTDFIDIKHFEKFDYIALGHLHRPQKVGYENIRYSGSIMKYSFSEYNHKKGYYEIDLKEKNNIDIKFNEIYPKRDIRVVEGRLEELLKEEYSDDYILIRLYADGEIYEPKARLSKVFPNILHMEIIKNKSIEKKENINIKNKLKRKDIFGLFEDFYEDSTDRKF
ncbi:MAG: exonuclease SbcCD subunit D, partial [Andreesenia angusta]|nr:exonuclease SbcCD subunit D [Andreesenia angusta]